MLQAGDRLISVGPEEGEEELELLELCTRRVIRSGFGTG